MHPNNESNIKMQYTVFFCFFLLPRLLKINLYAWYFLKKQKFNYVLPDLDSRVHVIVDIIIFQYSMSVVIKIHSNLFRDITILGGVKARSYRTKFWSSKPVFRCVSCSSWVPVCFLWSPTLRPECYCTPHFPLLHPGPFHATNRKNRESYSMTRAYCVYLFVLSAASSVLQSVHAHHIDSSMLPVMDLVVPYYRTAVRSDLNASQGISINIISLNEAPPITKYVNASLVSIEDGISPRLWADSSLYRSSSRQINQFTVCWVLSELSKS